MKKINLHNERVPFKDIVKGECYLYSPCTEEHLYMKLSDDYHQEHNAFSIDNGFLVQHEDDLMVIPVDIEIDVRRK